MSSIIIFKKTYLVNAIGRNSFHQKFDPKCESLLSGWYFKSEPISQCQEFDRCELVIKFVLCAKKTFETELRTVINIYIYKQQGWKSVISVRFGFLVKSVYIDIFTS